MEASDQPESAIEVLDRVRQIHHRRRSSALVYGKACFHMAAAIVRHANDSSGLSSKSRGELVERAVAVTLQGSDAASAELDDHEGNEFAEEVLKLIMTGGSPNRLAALPECEPAIAQLKE